MWQRLKMAKPQTEVNKDEKMTGEIIKMGHILMGLIINGLSYVGPQVPWLLAYSPHTLIG